MAESGILKRILDAQQEHWERAFSEEADFFGDEPSKPARSAARLFSKAGFRRILELGVGQGRDTLFFASRGFQTTAIDYSRKGLEDIKKKASGLGLSGLIRTDHHDIREPLPFDDETFDACFSHMLYCMALSTAELESLSREIGRVLRPGGLNVYTVRHKGDALFGKGIHRGEDMYETGGFIVHFFDGEKVKHLSAGYEIIGVDEFEEGELPRKLFMVTLKKNRPGGQ
ncbi:MAG TPA: class I SAM-dependent methyltransferase [Syntrophales bacterium]|jgi:SAM-dependent methyltransferase|nr:class I SAM-dependent methyltransferase [Syntrophales bacterium]HPI56802.1 class I SAM-dependent methyltransferase [Syntrophales bacterium]HPN25760.1 class I SAM-dependent methyltransferase [Syntrophales bacterium]HQM28725.1 class I SAM-dependent methyltransferase [Syntrophales bacterium]